MTLAIDHRVQALNLGTHIASALGAQQFVRLGVLSDTLAELLAKEPDAANRGRLFADCLEELRRMQSVSPPCQTVSVAGERSDT